MRGLVLAALSLLLATLSGCADLIDTDQRRLCRSLLPALEPAYDGFDVLSTDELTGRAVDGVVVRLTYRARHDAATGQRPAARVPVVATLTCSFAPNMSGKSSELVSVAGRGGVLGPVRLHVLQRSLRDLMGLFRATAIRDVRNHNAKIRRFVVEVFRVEISLNTELKRTGFAVGEPSGVS